MSHLTYSTYIGAEALTGQFEANDTSLQFLLGDLGCSGSESNLLDCLPKHNCKVSNTDKENAGVQCLRKGIT